MSQVRLNPTKTISASPAPQCLLNLPVSLASGTHTPVPPKPVYMWGQHWERNKRAEMTSDGSQATDYSTQAQNLSFHYTSSLLKKKKKIILVVRHLETRTTSKAAVIKLYHFTIWTPYFRDSSPSCHFWFIIQLTSDGGPPLQQPTSCYTSLVQTHHLCLDHLATAVPSLQLLPQTQEVK